ncbi:MAG: hypothetical protein KC422_20310 [Trueperaceae bacterium]|nr:hypothetical protein [Trueperaceae bacterium]
MPIVFKLKSYLSSKDITGYAIEKFVENGNYGISGITARKWSSGDRTPPIDKLDTLIKILRDMTGEKVGIGDLLEYEE